MKPSGRYARRFAGAGAVYEYLTHGAHPWDGVLTAGIFFLGTLFLGGGGIYLGVGNLAEGFWNTHISDNGPAWWVWGLIALVTAVLGWYALTLRIDPGVESMIPTGRGDLDALRTFHARFGSDEVVVLALHSDRLFSGESLKRIDRLTQRAAVGRAVPVAWVRRGGDGDVVGRGLGAGGQTQCGRDPKHPDRENPRPSPSPVHPCSSRSPSLAQATGAYTKFP